MTQVKAAVDLRCRYESVEQRGDDKRNGLTNYPVVADPEGTGLNQAWLQLGAAS